ncbi:MAG: MotA/TolQ/ExbB proton channel family protein [Pseudomonadota bacterium]
MFWLQETLTAIRDFLELGGDVLVVIAVLTLVMWIAILERVFFLNFGVKRQVKDTSSKWHDWPDHKSWKGKQVRSLLLAEIDWNAWVGIPLIKTMVALCPLLGLLGTVTGMIAVFDVMAVAGTGNARSMAAGVSKATVPTMAGMVAALSGVFAVTYLERKAKKVVLDADETLIEQD